MEPEAFKPFTLAKDLKVEAGQVVDLGTFDVTTGQRVRPRPPDRGAADVPITGRIVDLEGRPVAGVSVKVGDARIPKSDDLTPGSTASRRASRRGSRPGTSTTTARPREPPRARPTDQDGRFRLEGFGADGSSG